MIRQGTRKGGYPSASVLSKDLGVSTRTILRDLDLLRDDEHAPIEYDPSKKGFRLADATWQLPAVQLSAGELFAFAIARKVIERFEGTPLEVDMRSVLRKISESLEGVVTFDIDATTDHLTVLSEDHVIIDPDLWAKVVQCVSRHERVSVRYQKFSGEMRQHTLSPYHLISYHGNWYLLAEPDGRDEVLTFAVSRIKELRQTGEFFEVPSSFSIEEHIASSFGIVGGEEVFKVRLHCSKKIATYIRERIWHPSQKIIEKRDGSIELQMETAGWKALVRWILSWQPDVKVISPKRLRDRIELKMRQGLNENKRGTG